jgi:hypothetical protein
LPTDLMVKKRRGTSVWISKTPPIDSTPPTWPTIQQRIPPTWSTEEVGLYLY